MWLMGGAVKANAWLGAAGQLQPQHNIYSIEGACWGCGWRLDRRAAALAGRPPMRALSWARGAPPWPSPHRCRPRLLLSHPPALRRPGPAHPRPPWPACLPVF